MELSSAHRACCEAKRIVGDRWIVKLWFPNVTGKPKSFLSTKPRLSNGGPTEERLKIFMSSHPAWDQLLQLSPVSIRELGATVSFEGGCHMFKVPRCRVVNLRI
jgi:hypothetical protein